LYRFSESLTSAAVGGQMLHKGWPECSGIGGRLRPESVAGIERNTQQAKGKTRAAQLKRFVNNYIDSHVRNIHIDAYENDTQHR
jgi:hypothetical protein